MRGLKTQEGSKFERFWEIVQNKAEKQNMVFFLECGEGREFETPGMEGEDLRGWLVPFNQADQFEFEWKGGPVDNTWEDFIAWVEWDDSSGEIKVQFKTY